MTTEIPILIPVKEYSERCNKENYALLPYTAKWLHAQDLADAACVITDSPGLMEMAGSLSLKSHLEIRKAGQDELTSCWNFARQNSIELFYLCPVTQPFRSSKLLQQMKDMFTREGEHWDFITTVSSVQDRGLYFIKKIKTEYLFRHESKTRKGCDCNTEYMIDGALYLIRTSFLETVMNAENTNEIFWKGKFTCVENEAPFMDIDTQDDMNKFRFLQNNFEESAPSRVYK